MKIKIYGIMLCLGVIGLFTSCEKDLDQYSRVRIISVLFRILQKIVWIIVLVWQVKRM